MADTTLEYVTLATGHVRRSLPGEVGADTLRVLRGEVLPALAVPDGEPCGMHAASGGAVLTIGVGWAGPGAPGCVGGARW